MVGNIRVAPFSRGALPNGSAAGLVRPRNADEKRSYVRSRRLFARAGLEVAALPIPDAAKRGGGWLTRWGAFPSAAPYNKPRRPYQRLTIAYEMPFKKKEDFSFDPRPVTLRKARGLTQIKLAEATKARGLQPPPNDAPILNEDNPLEAVSGCRTVTRGRSARRYPPD